MEGVLVTVVASLMTGLSCGWKNLLFGAVSTHGQRWSCAVETELRKPQPWSETKGTG